MAKKINKKLSLIYGRESNPTKWGKYDRALERRQTVKNRWII